MPDLPDNIYEAHQYYDSPPILVLVGSEDNLRSFYVHQELLTSRSAFFQNALKAGSPWTEGTDGIVKVPADEPALFRFYADLLYTGKVRLSKVLEEQKALCHVIKIEQECRSLHGHAAFVHTPIVTKKAIITSCRDYGEMLIRLYVLCDYLQDIAAKNLVLSTYVEVVELSCLFFQNEDTVRRLTREKLDFVDIKECLFFGSKDHIAYVYENTTQSSQLRKLVVELVANRVGDRFLYDREELPWDFFYDFAMSLAAVQRYNGFEDISVAKYHEKIPGDKAKGES